MVLSSTVKDRRYQSLVDQSKYMGFFSNIYSSVGY